MVLPLTKEKGFHLRMFTCCPRYVEHHFAEKCTNNKIEMCCGEGTTSQGRSNQGHEFRK